MCLYLIWNNHVSSSWWQNSGEKSANFHKKRVHKLTIITFTKRQWGKSKMEMGIHNKLGCSKYLSDASIPKHCRARTRFAVWLVASRRLKMWSWKLQKEQWENKDLLRSYPREEHHCHCWWKTVVECYNLEGLAEGNAHQALTSPGL